MRQYTFTLEKETIFTARMTPNRAAYWRERGYTISLDGSREAADRLMAAAPDGEWERQ